LAGFALAYVAGEVERGAALVNQAIQIDSNLGLARTWMGWTNVYLGEHEAAIKQLEMALRLNPLDPRRYSVWTAMAYAHFLAGRHDEALRLATVATGQQPNYLAGQRILLGCQAVTGRLEEARANCAIALQIDPGQRVSGDKSLAPFRPQDLRKLREAYRLAGMPE
jgi:adenylate cyclase